MKKTFDFNKRQLAALERFNKAFSALDKAGVLIVLNTDYNSIEAVALTRKQSRNLDLVDCKETFPEGCEDVTEDLLSATKMTSLSACFIDKYTHFLLHNTF